MILVFILFFQLFFFFLPIDLAWLIVCNFFYKSWVIGLVQFMSVITVEQRGENTVDVFRQLSTFQDTTANITSDISEFTVCYSEIILQPETMNYQNYLETWRIIK